MLYWTSKRGYARRWQYDQVKQKIVRHLVEGLKKALSILDQVIEDRASKDKRNAKDNLSAKFGFTEAQARSNCFLAIYRCNEYRHYGVTRRSR